MALTLEFEFDYPFDPSITIRVRAPETGRSRLTSVLIDTGADRTILDLRLAERIGLDGAGGRNVTLVGLGSGAVEAVVMDVELLLLDEEDLSVIAPIAFAPSHEIGVGNLLGLDLLAHFDFGLAHGERLGYLGRR
jgi:predicted aspartyl protease